MPIDSRLDRRLARSRGDWRSFAPFLFAFALVAVGFVGSTVYAEVRAAQIDREIEHTRTNALPSVDGIVGAQTALRRLEVASEEFLEARGTDERSAAAAGIDEAHKAFDGELSEELATGNYPGEAEQTTLVMRAVDELDALLARMKERSPPDDARGASFSARDVRSGVEHLGTALDRLLAINARSGHAAIDRVVQIREGSIEVALLLDALCVAFSVVAAWMALRALESRRAAERAHAEILETRAQELEFFAARVAHDLLGPLSALSFTLSLVRRNSERGTAIDEPLRRAGNCLKRSQRLVDGVLDFARSAASPSAGDRTSLREAIDGVVEEVRAEANGAVEINVVPWTGEIVFPCTPGILGSVLSNLVRNAVKYIGEGDEKRVTIRVVPTREAARVEVADTGPGVTPALAEHIFEPYVRAPDNAQPGLGLGLATVRRFVEAHGGRVGVEPSRGRGGLFWFQLPRAPARVARTAPTIPLGNTVTER